MSKSPARLRFAAFAALAAFAPPARADVAWAQFVAGGMEVRAIATGEACPALVVDGARVAMTTRAPASKRFPSEVCAAAVPPGAKRAEIDGETIALAPARDPRTIVVLGDTGCRIEGAKVQDCSDPKAWPFPAIAARAAGERPDLVIHVGDYLYREKPCVVGAKPCPAGPVGDALPAWDADFFAPAKPALAAAPWLFVRGNHEICARAGRGWTWALDPAPYPRGRDCRREDKPFAVTLAGLTLDVIDVAESLDGGKDSAETARRAADYAALDVPAAGETWIVQHRPIRAIRKTPAGKPATGPNLTLAQASAPPFPSGVSLVLSGHLHTFQALNFAGAPSTLVAGVGGDLLLKPGWSSLIGVSLAGETVASGFAVPSRFGYMLLIRMGVRRWTASVRAPDGAILATCAIAHRRVDCAKAP